MSISPKLIFARQAVRQPGARRRWEHSDMHVREARRVELPLLRDLERAAGELFREVGMAEIAEDEPLSLDELLRYQHVGRAWVIADPNDLPAAYLIADLVDGNLHIEQVSVHPRHARQRLGRQLLDHVAQHAIAAGVPALTLTTFATVPWNAPYYERCGFRVIGEDALGPGLRTIRQHEASRGLDRWPRVCMRRDL
jgi:GNAT superfamily N-acetyltransferase